MNHSQLAWQGIRKKAQRSGNTLAAFYKSVGTSLANSLFITKDINPPSGTKKQSLSRRQMPTTATSGSRGNREMYTLSINLGLLCGHKSYRKGF